MAKTGKNAPAYDPFSSGSKAFGALDDALGELDEPQGKLAKKDPPPPAANAAAGEVAEAPAQKKSTEVRRKKAVKSSSGAGAESNGRPSLKSRGKTTKRFTTTIEESVRYEKAAMHLSAELGIAVDFSKLTRALWEVYLLHETDIVRNVPQDEEWSRPSNSDAVRLAELDERLTDLLKEGLAIASRRGSRTRSQE